MLRVDSLTLKNFRGIREGKIENLADVNVFIGRNNSGKSTIIEAIMRGAFKSSKTDEDLLGRRLVMWTDSRNEPSDWSPELFYRGNLNEPMIVEMRLRKAGAPLSSIGGFRYTISGNSHSIPPLQEIKPDDSCGDEVLAFFRRVTTFRPPDAGRREIEQKLWTEIIKNRWDSVLTQALNRIFSLESEGFQYSPGNKLWVLFPSYGIPLDFQGDGTRAAMRCLMILSCLRGTMFCLEEPECHQHPGSLERFAQTVCGLAKKQQVQLFVSTHSMECVRAFLGAANKTESESALFHLTLHQGELTARRLDPQAVETLQETGVDVRFLDLYA